MFYVTPDSGTVNTFAPSQPVETELLEDYIGYYDAEVLTSISNPISSETETSSASDGTSLVSLGSTGGSY
jgi:hypothetical protein